MNNKEFEKKKIYSEASGVMAAVDDNIYINLNEYGLYEEYLKDTDKGLSEKALSVSPNFNQELNESVIADELYSHQENIQFDSKIGYYTGLYAGHVSEGDYRKNASSGGMGTWILKELREKDLVDYVIHVKPNLNDDHILFNYDISEDLEQIIGGAKTKYYPVELSQVLKTVKNNPGRYAVIGIPSFIYAIRLLTKLDPVFNERIKYTVGLICGHQKSSKFAESMAYQVGFEPENLKHIDFRYKLTDKPASNYAVKVQGIKNGKLETVIKPAAELYGQNWGWGFFKPIASDFTDDVFNETADIVLGDAWLPEYVDDSKGNNVVIIRNTEILNLVDQGIKEGKLKMDLVSSKTIFNSQASHYRHTHDELAYRLYLKEKHNEWHPKKRVEASNNISNYRRHVQDLRKIISTESHIEFKNAVENKNINLFIVNMSKYTDKYRRLYRIKRYQKVVTNFKEIGFLNIIKKVIGKFKSN